MRRRLWQKLGRIAVFLILIAPAVLAAQSFNLGPLSYSLNSGSYSTVTSYGNYAFAATGYGFTIYDVSDPSNPLEIVNTPTPGLAKYVCTDGDYLFVADQGNGLLIFDISDIMHPLQLDDLEMSVNLRTLYPRGSYIYAASEDNGLCIINYSDPYNLELVNTVYIGGEVFRVSSYGNMLYVAQGAAGMGTYDVSNPVNPDCQMIWNMPGGNTRDLFVFPTGDYVALADAQNGVYLLSLQYPEVPTWVATDTVLNYLATSVSGNLNFGVSSWYGHGVQTFDFSGQELDYLSVGGCMAAYQIGNYLYATRGDSGFRVINCQDPNSLYAVTDVLLNRGTSAVQVHNDIAYVANLEAGLTVMEVSNPGNPSLLETIPTGAWAKDVLLSPDYNYLYVADFYFGVNVFSLADPQHPAWIRTVATEPDTGCHSLDIRNGVMYVTVYSHGVNVFSLADPSNPVLTWHSPDTTSKIRELDISADGNFLYAVSEDSGLLVYSITSADSLTYQYTSKILRQPFDIMVHGQYAYVADWNDGLYVLNVANPAYIYKMDSLEAQDKATGVTYVDANHLLFSDWSAGAVLVDVTNPSNIFEISRCNTPGTAWKACCEGDRIYLSDVYDLAILDLQAPANIPLSPEAPPSVFQLHPAYPNPFNSSTRLSFTIARDMNVKLAVYDVTGRHVQTLLDQRCTSGSHTVDFNPAGLASGIYFATLNTDVARQTQKLLLLK